MVQCIRNQCLPSSIMFSTHCILLIFIFFRIVVSFTYAVGKYLCVKRKKTRYQYFYTFDLHTYVLFELYFCKICFLEYKWRL